VKHPKPLPYDLAHLGVEEYYSYHDRWGHHIIQCYALKKHIKALVHQGYLREFILTPRSTSEVEQRKDTLFEIQPQQTEHADLSHI